MVDFIFINLVLVLLPLRTNKPEIYSGEAFCDYTEELCPVHRAWFLPQGGLSNGGHSGQQDSCSDTGQHGAQPRGLMSLVRQWVPWNPGHRLVCAGIWGQRLRKDTLLEGVCIPPGPAPGSRSGPGEAHAPLSLVLPLPRRGPADILGQGSGHSVHSP